MVDEEEEHGLFHMIICVCSETGRLEPPFIIMDVEFDKLVGH